LIQATKPGGDLLLTVDAHNYFLLKKIFQLIPGDILHPHQYSLPDYAQMLQKHRCTIHKTQRLKKGHLFDYWAIWVKKES
jgi:2-polyprenyl-6-hydroxyphenyl methylase/3-demethylubiquinone-9 3-methyltransferase